MAVCDSAGRRCGGRAASVIPGGRLEGDGRYIDSYGRNRIYGRGNDIYDDNYNNNDDSGLKSFLLKLDDD